jgi:hypothetical protein
MSLFILNDLYDAVLKDLADFFDALLTAEEVRLFLCLDKMVSYPPSLFLRVGILMFIGFVPKFMFWFEEPLNPS